MKKTDKETIIRLIALIIFIAFTIAATIFAVPFVKSLSSAEGRLAIQEKVNSLGIWGVFLFLLMQAIQVIVALIPGEPFEIAGGILFGAVGGFFLCLLGILLGTICVFYLVRTIGKPLVNVFVSEEKFKKFKILNDETKLEALVFILFLIPGTPKDVLTYMVPLTKIPPLRFFAITAFARMPSIIGSAVVGGNLGKGDWFWAAAIFIGAAAIGLAGIFMHQKIINFIKSKLKNKT